MDMTSYQPHSGALKNGASEACEQEGWCASDDRVSKVNLEPTRLCDADHPSIVAKARELTKGAANDDERAQRIFYFVRDQIPFRVGEYTLPASTVLAQGHGMCVTKTVLMSALMRAAGLPTRYRWVPLDKRGFNGFYPRWLNRINLLKSPTVWFHCHCEVHLDGRWATADGLLDRPLYEGALALGHLTREAVPTIEWGLTTDVLRGLIVEDKGVLTDPDGMFEKAHREDISPRLPIVHIAFPMMNRHLDRHRMAMPRAKARD